MKRLAVINGLRGYAILGVIYFHLIGVFFNQPGWYTVFIGDLPIFPLTYLGHGWLGVDLFFILSGFVLYLPYANGSRELKTGASVWTFYKHRASRLLPLYYISLVISIFFIVHASNIHEWSFWKDMILMFTITFNFTKETFIPSYNYVLWSLGIEVLFSVIFPLLIWLIVKKGIIKFCMVVFYMSFIVRVISCFYPNYYLAPHLNMIKDSLFGRLDDFATGMLLCHWFVSGWKQKWFEQYSIVLFFLSLFVITLGCYFSDYVFLHYISSYFEPLINTSFQLGFGLLTLSLLHMKKNPIQFLFANKTLQLCGMMCYSLYLWHGNMRMVFIADYTPLRIITYLMFLFLLSFLTYRYIEFGNKKMEDILPQ
ncbi:MAG: acyltransferase [Bacteroidota bacterium]|nr:acyltransferase [Bacteroidota bacterium]